MYKWDKCRQFGYLKLYDPHRILGLKFAIFPANIWTKTVKNGKQSPFFSFRFSSTLFKGLITKGRKHFYILLQNPGINFKILRALQTPGSNSKPLRVATPPSFSLVTWQLSNKISIFKNYTLLHNAHAFFTMYILK